MCKSSLVLLTFHEVDKFNSVGCEPDVSRKRRSEAVSVEHAPVIICPFQGLQYLVVKRRVVPDAIKFVAFSDETI